MGIWLHIIIKKELNMKFKTLIGLIVVILIYSACSSKQSLGKMNKKVLDLAHRGYSLNNKESTLEAFKYAIEKNTDGLEFDIRQTFDGVVIVSHDQKVAKLEKNIKDLYYLEITKNTNIMSFKDVVKLAKKHQKTIWVEIKDSDLYPSIIENMLEVIDKYTYSKKTIVQSFNLKDLEYVHNKNTDIKLLKLFFLNYSFKKLPKYIDYIGLPIMVGVISSGVINSVHEKGYEIIFWRESSFFENKYFINNLIQLGADGFMLDTPLQNLN